MIRRRLLTESENRNLESQLADETELVAKAAYMETIERPQGLLCG